MQYGILTLLLTHASQTPRLESLPRVNEYAIQCGDASGTGLFDVHTRSHAHDAIQQVLGGGSADIFPALVEPTTVVGQVKQDISERLGIPNSTVVAAGSGDNMMSALGVVRTARFHARGATNL